MMLKDYIAMSGAPAYMGTVLTEAGDTMEESNPKNMVQKFKTHKKQTDVQKYDARYAYKPQKKDEMTDGNEARSQMSSCGTSQFNSDVEERKSSNMVADYAWHEEQDIAEDEAEEAFWETEEVKEGEA